MSKGFFSRCNQIHRFLRIWSHLLKKSLRIHWKLSRILKISKQVYEKMFFDIYISMYILKAYSIHYTLRQNTNVKESSFGQNKRYKKWCLFSFTSSSSSQFYFNLWFLYELKLKVCLSKTIGGIFHFRFRFVFIKEKCMDSLTLKCPNSFQS